MKFLTLLLITLTRLANADDVTLCWWQSIYPPVCTTIYTQGYSCRPGPTNSTICDPTTFTNTPCSYAVRVCRTKDITIDRLAQSDAGYALSWPAVPNYPSTVEWSTNLVQWFELVTFTTDQERSCWFDQATDNRFYRVRIP